MPIDAIFARVSGAAHGGGQHGLGRVRVEDVHRAAQPAREGGRPLLLRALGEGLAPGEEAGGQGVAAVLADEVGHLVGEVEVLVGHGGLRWCWRQGAGRSWREWSWSSFASLRVCRCSRMARNCM